MRKTFQYKLYQAKRNKHLHQQIDIAAGIYNHCIALHKRYYRLYGKSLNKYSSFAPLRGQLLIENVCKFYYFL